MKREKIACSCHNVSRAFLSSFLQDMKRFPEDYQQ